MKDFRGLLARDSCPPGPQSVGVSSLMVSLSAVVTGLICLSYPFMTGVCFVLKPVTPNPCRSLSIPRQAAMFSASKSVNKTQGYNILTRLHAMCPQSGVLFRRSRGNPTALIVTFSQTLVSPGIYERLKQRQAVGGV